MKYEKCTEKIIGCAMKVHSWFGPGFPEIIYQRSLLIELKKMDLKCGTEVEKIVYYDGNVVGKRRLDVIVDDIILVEIKAIGELDNASISKIINYLKLFNLEVGLLLNFGSKSLQYKRYSN